MASLLITEGTPQGAYFPLSQPLTSVGRDDQCTIQILDEQISRKHLQVRLEPKDGCHYAADYRSANGVFINNNPILEPTQLKDGDRISIGNTTLIYLSGDHKDATSAQAAAHAITKSRGEWKRTTLIRKS